MIVLLYFIQFIFRLIFFAPVTVALALMFGAAWLAAAIARQTPLKREITANYKLLLPDSPAPQLADKLISNFSQSILELICVPFFRREHFRRCFRLDNLENVRQSLKDDRGAIILTIHAGNYELAAANLSLEGFPVTGILRAGNEPLFKFINRRRGLHNVELINILDQNMFQLAASALNDKRLVYLLADTGAQESRHAMINLLGHQVPVATGWLTLAQRTGCAVIPMLANRENHINVYTFMKPFYVEKNNRAEVIQKVGAIFETFIKEHPDQWAMFFNSYETKRILGGEIMTNDELRITNEGVSSRHYNNVPQAHNSWAFGIRHFSLIALVLLAAFLYFFKLGSFSLYDAAETTYGEFIKQMWLTGDWLTLHYNGQIIFDKPPLFYWLANIAIMIFGFNEFAIRFWSAVCGVATVALTYFMARKFYNKKTGILSALVVMTALQFLVQSRIAEIDILLTLLLNGALFSFYFGYCTNDKKYYWLSYLAMALALPTKGIIGVILPCFTIFLFLLFKKELKKLSDLSLLPGFLIITLIGLPWYVIEYLIHGQKFVDFALGFLFLARFQGVVAGHPGPWYYYFLAIIIGFAPWSHFLPYGLIRNWRQRLNAPELFMFCFIVPVFIVFSVAKTKLPSYLLPLYPFLAIIVGKLWTDFLDNQKKLQRGMIIANILLAGVVSLLIIGVIILGTHNYSGQYPLLMPQLKLLAVILIGGGLLSIIAFFIKAYRLSFAALPIMVFGLTFVLVTQSLPLVETLKGTKELAAKVSSVIKPNEEIAAYNTGNRPGIVFYNNLPIIFLQSEKELQGFIAHKRGYCFVIKSELAQLKNVKVLADQGDLAVVY
ncbi:glycosyltransferase family 39 protein [Candidatus Saganbacteria bacterium]|nr:glycosyltransferase family 39 protein [Candidatus Saganbacteria bacterium]